MAHSDRSNSIWPNDIIITWHIWLVLSCIGSQWALCSTFKYMTSACCSSSQRASETLHLPQLHLYRSATRWFMYDIGGYFMYVIFAAVVFLTCPQQHVVDVLAAVVDKVHRSSTWVKVQIRIIKYYSSKSKSTAFSILLEWKYKSTRFFMYLSKKVLIDRFILQFYIDYFI